MDLAFLSGLLASLVSLVGLFFAVYTVRKMNNKLEQFEETADNVGSFFRYEQDKDGNTMLDARAVAMINALTSGLAKSMKMSVLGGLSGPARLEKGLKGAIAADVVDNQMPIINLLGDMVGINTKKYISKHPDAMMQLAAKFAPQLQNLKLGGSNIANRGNDGVGYGK